VAASVQTLGLTVATAKLATLTATLARQGTYLEKLAQTLGHLLEQRDQLAALLKNVQDENHDEHRVAQRLAREVVPQMALVRQFADELETLVDAELWTLPTYHQLLFVL